MDEIKLDVQIRNELGSDKIRPLKREGFVPAIVYGGNKKPTAIKVERRAYEKIMRLHRGETVLFHVNVLEGDKKLRDYSVIVKEEQHDPVSDQVLHIDFHRISLTEKIEVKVAIVAKGEPIGVKRDGGSLEHVMWELEVKCLPTQIPHNISIDVSNLEVDQVIHVKDLVLPAGVTTKHDLDAIVVTVVPKREETVTAEPTEAGPTEPEVIKEKKKDEEGKVIKEGKEGKEAPAKKEEGKAETK